MKKVAILQSNYIPWKGYFDIIRQADVFVMYDEVQYTKNDWRNRNLIKTPNGPQWLTIPVSQKNLGQKINETEVSLKNWNVKHWNTLVANYGKAPFFREYSPMFKELYLGMDTTFLSEINLKFIRLINEILEIDTEIIDSTILSLVGDKNERLIEAITKLNGTHYISGPAAQSYMDVNTFEANNITVEWMDYQNYPEYNQQHPPFSHGVTVVDLIFNEGKKSKKILIKQ
jgi:hypothetical protein